MNFEQILGDSVSKDVIKQLEEALETTLKNALFEKDQEIQRITELADVYTDNVRQDLTEKAESYAEMIYNDMYKKAEGYGQTLQESFAQKEADYIQRIEEIKNAAEGYAELIFDDLCEKANGYTEQFVKEYQESNQAMFEAIQNEETAVDVLTNITHVLQGFGFDKSQNDVIRELKESVKQRDKTIRQLNNKLHESDMRSQKEMILDEATRHLSYSERQRVIDASNDILTESLEGYRNVVNVLVSKYEKNDDVVNKTNERINESVNTNNKTNLFDSVANKGKSVKEIASKII